ncbi:MAG: thioredoxin domain-containing protein [Nocardioidaceae bacterium]
MANRLANATSPYLLQHAENPVDWWEWGPEAFAEAKRRDTPILLSVGYAACHWCHVMAHESFEDPVTASYLNAHFVSIKVDREERPDVDAIYMQATQAMTGQGGWPMTVVLTPDGAPFFAGTYFPDKPRGGQASFRQILSALADAWATRRDEVMTVAGELTGHLAAPLTLAGDQPIDETVLAQAVEALIGEYDANHPGFGNAPKFPPSMVLEFLLRHAARTHSSPAQQMSDRILTAMARGGIYDQLGGGFARYSVDRAWVVPHFEKMLYDNAQLLGLYVRWWRQTGDPLGERVARETGDFLLRELATAEGGFASALDADSEGVEGKFYVWMPSELEQVLGADDGQWGAALFEVTEQGTFEHGASTLQLLADPDDPARWLRVRERLLAAREQRVRPARDDKVVAAWNGLAISSLAQAGLLLEEPRYVAAAVKAGQLLWDLHLVDGTLRRVSRDGVVGKPAGVLEDYGAVADGFLALLQATGEAVWLERAGVLLDAAIDRFGADDGGFFDTASDAEQLVARPRDPADNASPSGASATTNALISYAAITGSGRHRDRAEAALRTVRELALKASRFAGWWLAAAEAAVAGPLEIAVVGDDPGLALEARRATSPGAVVLVNAAGTPLMEGRDLVGGRTTVYVCRGMVCDRPVTDVEALRAAFG